jgi:hypothetical protein
VLAVRRPEASRNEPLERRAEGRGAGNAEHALGCAVEEHEV